MHKLLDAWEIKIAWWMQLQAWSINKQSSHMDNYNNNRQTPLYMTNLRDRTLQSLSKLLHSSTRAPITTGKRIMYLLDTTPSSSITRAVWVTIIIWTGKVQWLSRIKIIRVVTVRRTFWTWRCRVLVSVWIAPYHSSESTMPESIRLFSNCPSLSIIYRQINNLVIWWTSMQRPRLTRG